MQRRLFLAVPGLGLAACASLLPGSLHYRTEELQQALARRFPIERRWLEALDLRLPAPRLSTVPERQKLALELQADLRDRLFGGRWQARLALESKLRWEPSDQTLRLAEVEVTSLSLAEPGRAPALDTRRLGAAVVSALLDDAVVLRASPEQRERLRRLGVQPAGVQVVADGVRIDLAPA